MVGGNPLDTSDGFLTESMREYLADPEGFEAEYGEQRVTNVRHRIRNARAAAIEQLQVLDEHTDLWQRERVPGEGYAFPSTEPHVDVVPIHEPLPDAHSVDFELHSDTLQALSSIQQELSRFAVNEIVDQLNRNEIPEEFDSRAAYREYLQDRRQDFRTAYDSRKLPNYEVFLGDDFITVDDVIRLGLQMTPTTEAIKKIESDPHSLFPGINQESRHEMMDVFSNAFDRSYLRRQK